MQGDTITWCSFVIGKVRSRKLTVALNGYAAHDRNENALISVMKFSNATCELCFFE